MAEELWQENDVGEIREESHHLRVLRLTVFHTSSVVGPTSTVVGTSSPLIFMFYSRPL